MIVFVKKAIILMICGLVSLKVAGSCIDKHFSRIYIIFVDSNKKEFEVLPVSS